MASIYFLTRTTKDLSKLSDAEVIVWIRVRNGRVVDARCATDISLPVKYWEEYISPSKKASSFPDKATEDRIENSCKILDKLSKEILAKTDKGLIKDSETLRHYVRTIIDKERRADVVVPHEPMRLLRYLVDRMKDGGHRTEGKEYDYNTIKQWGNFTKLVEAYNRIAPIDLESINRAFWDGFVRHMQQSGYMVKSMNKYLSCFRAYLEYAKSNGVKIGDAATSSYYKLAVKEDDKAAKTYLTETELQALYDVKLQEGSIKDKVRDIFLLGCYLGQRVSDYNNLSKSDFTTTARGNNVVKIKQEKTETEVTIPIIYPQVYEIAKKYDYKFPRLYDQEINRTIKNILQELSSTVPTLLKKERTTLTMKERDAERKGTVTYMRDEKGKPCKFRYDLITTHTARRSCITNLYLRGIFNTIQLMSISGHKTERAFFEYLCMSSEEVADKIMDVLNASTQKQELF